MSFRTNNGNLSGMKQTLKHIDRHRSGVLTMKKSAFLLIAVCTLLIINGSLTIHPAVAAGSDYSKEALGTDQQKGEKIIEKFGLTETLGPLAPVAMSPFFGLACLSGTSMLCKANVLPDNEFLQGNDVLSNPLVFLAFAGLALITSVPRLVSTSKVFAEAMDRVETYAGIISYGVVLMAAQDAAGDQAQAIVYNAGFITITYSGLLAIAAAINIFVISTVRLFFELLTLISPIPTLDAMFECANKTVAGIFMAIYAFNPWLAFVINLILFLICLVIFRWVNRRIGYFKAMLLEPMLLGLVRGMLGRTNYDPDKSTLRRIARTVPGTELVVKCFPMRKIGKIKIKDRCYLAFGSEGTALVRMGLLTAPLVKKITTGQLTKDIDEGLIAYSVHLQTEHKPVELVFGRVYTQKLDQIREKLIYFAAQSAPARTEPAPPPQSEEV